MQRSIPFITLDANYESGEWDWKETASEEASEEASDEASDELVDLLFDSSSQSTRGLSFWTFHTLCRVLTRDRVLQALQSCGETFKDTDELEFYIDQIRPVYGKAEDVRNSKVPCKPSSTPKRCLRILAVLVLMDQVSSIKQFIDEGINDGDLPLELSNIRGRKRKFRLAKRLDGSRKASKCFSHWKSSTFDVFDQFQFRVNVPFFDYQHGKVLHYDLPDGTILPWVSLETAGINSARGIRSMSGGEHGYIRQVCIEPRSHNFHELSSAISISSDTFAVKSFSRYPTDARHFASEVEMLKRFSGYMHPHLVTLLASFTLEGTNNLIFPWAEADLFSYWEHHEAPSAADDILWLSAQVLGLATALNLIHNPPLEDGSTREFARHGDVKPENVLWHKSINDSRGIFVISDLGLAAVNSKKSRSLTRNDAIGFTPTYRPPECDIENGYISRSSDVWSLGCLFLEMITWMLGGWELVQSFAVERMAPSMTGLRTDTFFDILRVADSQVANKVTTGQSSTETSLKPRVFQFEVKEQVTVWIEKLHNHESCTQYTHDLLDLVQHGMLLVEIPLWNIELVSKSNQSSEQTKPLSRYSSGKIVEVLEGLHYMVKNTPSYSAQAVPQPRGRSEAPPAFFANKNSHIDLRLARAQHSQPQNARTLFHSLRRSLRVKETRSISRPAEPVVAEVGSIQPPAVGLSILEQIHDAISNKSFRKDEDNQTTKQAAIDISWSLRRCLQTELDDNTDLSSILTITGNADHSWAVSCREYVSEQWAEFGVTLLRSLESVLQKVVGLKEAITVSDPASPHLGLSVPHVEEEHEVPAKITFQGTLSEISIGVQFFAWIAATFRPPKARELSCSTVQFEELPGDFRYSLKLTELSSLDDREQGTCWKALFPSTIMAYDFPAPFCSGFFGLRIPVQAMFELSEMLSDTTLEDEAGNDNGVYFNGDIWTLYPTGYSNEEQTVQWHIVRRTTDEISDPGLAPGQDGPYGLLREVDLETMAKATAVLGYCQQVIIQLGTESRLKQYEEYRRSGAKPECPPPEASLGAASFTGSALGRFMTAFTVNFKYRKGLIDARKKDDEDMYSEVLKRAAAQPVILFDTKPGMERAWMVPQLSLVLDLFNFWAFCQTDTNEEISNQVQYAHPGSDGGKMAMDVLSNREYADQIAIKAGHEGETEMRVGAMIKRINMAVEARWLKNAESDEGAPGTIRIGQTPMTGWDWMDLIPEFSTGHSIRRNVRSGFRWLKRHSKPNWSDLADKLPLFVGQNLGEVLKPAQTSAVCGLWYPLPGGLEPNYLAASVRCLESLSSRYGKGDDVCTLFHKQVWRFTDDSIFKPCDRCMLDPSICTKQPQAINKKRTKDILPVLPSWKDWRDGAIIFGVGRKTNPGISLGYLESLQENIAMHKEAIRISQDEKLTRQEVNPPPDDRIATSDPEQDESSSIAELNAVATDQIATAAAGKAHREWAILWALHWRQIILILVLATMLPWELATSWISWVRDWWQVAVILVLLGTLL